MYKEVAVKLQWKYEHTKQENLKINKSREKMQSCCKKDQILSSSQSLLLQSQNQNASMLEVKKSKGQLSLSLQWVRPV